jgi:uncharacterized membrane protein (UPF0127 family)
MTRPRTPVRMPVRASLLGLLGLLVPACAVADDAGAAEGSGDPALAAFARDNDLGPLAQEQVTVHRAGRDDALLTVDVLVADAPDARARGLSRIATLPDGVGMLFVFTDPPGSGGRPGFWMLDTRMPLDIAFVADGEVVGVATMQPCPARPCPITHPGVDYDAALEVGAGVLTEVGVTVGDRVRRPGGEARG